eukprot:TRINITY_DN9874_c0_g1_i1.p1 TRINITY_DN9874_c0_g1~~TRINITY_DN9874_c0_g1_i1.p1  ORF type:complete len:289 (-),score=16.55 TRINITY_DN9874_c0_g1_i1:88-954(-)
MEIGLLPSDIIDTIVQYSEPHAAASIYLSCKYWHNRFKHIFDADRVVVSARNHCFDERFRSIFVLDRGRVKEYRLEYDRYDDDGDYPCIPMYRVAIGYFNTVRDSVKFIKQIKDILASTERTENTELLLDCAVEIGSKTASRLYITRDLGEQSIWIDVGKGMKILKLIKEADFVEKSFTDKSNLTIKIIQRSDEAELMYENKIKITPHGDALMKIRGDGGYEEVTLKTSPELYGQIIEIIQYSKHKTDLFTSQNIDKRYAKYLFYAELVTSNDISKCQLYFDTRQITC